MNSQELNVGSWPLVKTYGAPPSKADNDDDDDDGEDDDDGDDDDDDDDDDGDVDSAILRMGGDHPPPTPGMLE